MKYLHTHNTVSTKEWNEKVTLLNATAFHTHEWSVFSSEVNHSKTIYFEYTGESGKIDCMSFGLMVYKKLLFLPPLKELSLGSLPAARNDVSLNAVIEEIIEYCKIKSVVTLTIHSFGTPKGTELLKSKGFSVENRWEFITDINMSEEDLWKKMHSKKRNLIKKGQKAGLKILRCYNLDHVMILRKLALETKRRKEEANILFSVARESYYRDLKSKLIDTGLGRLYLAYDGNIAVAGSFFVGFNKSAYYMLSAADAEGLEKAAPDLILWTAMTDYQKEEYELFNLGGVSEQDLNGIPLEESGLYHFKSRFPVTVHPCVKGILILRPGVDKIYSLLRKAKAKFFSQ